MSLCDTWANSISRSKVISLKIKFKKLIIQSNKQADTNCEIKILVIKTPHSQLVQTLDILVIVMLWLSWCKTDDLRNWFRLPHSNQQLVEMKMVFIFLPLTFVRVETEFFKRFSHWVDYFLTRGSSTDMKTIFHGVPPPSSCYFFVQHNYEVISINQSIFFFWGLPLSQVATGSYLHSDSSVFLKSALETNRVIRIVEYSTISTLDCFEDTLANMVIPEAWLEFT